MINYRHSGSLGDIIFSVPALLSQKEEANLFLWDSVPGNYYAGCKHTSGPYRMSKAAAEWLLPLLNVQPGIKAELWKADRKVDVDLDNFRRLPGMNYLWGHIPKWFFYVVPGFFDLTQPWLSNIGTRPCSKALSKSIIVNRTSRYRNNIKYDILEDVDADILFVGVLAEYEEFVKEVPRAVFLECKDALAMAQTIASGLMFIGNQSVAFAIAEALKVPRVLEVCTWAGNVVPMGGLCYDAIQQRGFDFAVVDCLEKSL